ncbi:hypothetical protein IT157_03385, partial [bacterium]|nr:hypothetical protein [bacterium]
MKHVIIILLLMQGAVYAGGSIFGAQPAGDAQSVGGARTIGLGGAGLALWDSLGFHGDNAAQLGAITGTTLRIGATAGVWNTTSSGMTDTDSEFGWQSFRFVFAPHKRYHTGIGIDPIRRSDIRMFESTTAQFQTDTGWVDEPYER